MVTHQIHGVEHLLSGGVLLLLVLPHIGVGWSVAVGPGHGGSLVNQVGEGSSADQPVLVGVGIHEHLQQGVVQLGVAVALLVRGGPLHEPDEVLLGLVEGADSGVAGGGHLGLVVAGTPAESQVTE